MGVPTAPMRGSKTGREKQTERKRKREKSQTVKERGGSQTVREREGDRQLERGERQTDKERGERQTDRKRGRQTQRRGLPVGKGGAEENESLCCLPPVNRPGIVFSLSSVNRNLRRGGLCASSIHSLHATPLECSTTLHRMCKCIGLCKCIKYIRFRVMCLSCTNTYVCVHFHMPNSA